MARNFYLPPAQWQPPYALDGAEAHHLAHVLRLRPGEEIQLMDGQGRTGLFSITRLEKHKVDLELLREARRARDESACILAVGWGKNLRRTWLLEKAVEFGAAGVWFWQAERSQSRVPDAPQEAWTGQMIAAAKQCGNPWLPELWTIPAGAAGLLEMSQGVQRRVMLWEEQAGEPLLSVEDMRGPALYVLGPEGGFTSEEAELLIQGGIAPRSMGDRVLRWETAAVLSLGLHWWANQKAGQNGDRP